MNIEHYQARRKAKMSKYNSLLGNMEQHSIGNSASANVLSYHHDGGHKTETLNTNESTPLGSKIKAGELIGEQQRLSMSGGDRTGPAQAPQAFAHLVDGRAEASFASKGKVNLQQSADSNAL